MPKKKPVEITRTGITPDNVALHDCPSYSRRDIVHHPIINLNNGHVDCTCESFEMVLRKKAHAQGIRVVDIGHIQFHCPHIDAMIRLCLQVGDIALRLKQPEGNTP